jgi:hypothetical protein
MFAILIRSCLGFGMVGMAWLALRRACGAGLRGALLLDGGVVFASWLSFLLLTARPILAALVTVTPVAGLGLADRVKRRVLREPVVFADRAELMEIVRHPQLYLPFAGTSLVLSGAAVALALVAALMLAEPPTWTWSVWIACCGPALVLACLYVPCWPPLLRRLRRLYESMGTTGDPARDAQAFGLLACLVMQATVARAERPARQAQLARPSVALAPARWHADGTGAIVLVQSECFFDTGRLHPALGADLLPSFYALRREAWQHGRLSVPCWGANTIRSEFAVLTGITEDRLGLDRFNPYASFARVGIDSIAWQARAAGYRTVCVHPFDLGFYGRKRVMRRLGFDRLIGPDMFSSADHSGQHVADIDVARAVARLLEDPEPLLVFAITMGSHSPWDGPEAITLPAPLDGLPEAKTLARYLFRLRQADAALPILTASLRRRDGEGWLGWYGDHQPSFPDAFAAAGLTDPSTDYLLWNPQACAGGRRDIAAHELGAALLEAHVGALVRNTVAV